MIFLVSLSCHVQCDQGFIMMSNVGKQRPKNQRYFAPPFYAYECVCVTQASCLSEYCVYRQNSVELTERSVYMLNIGLSLHNLFTLDQALFNTDKYAGYKYGSYKYRRTFIYTVQLLFTHDMVRVKITL